MRKGIMKTMAMLCAITVVAASLAGCAGAKKQETKTASATQTPAVTNEVVKLSMMTTYYGATSPKYEGSDIAAEIKKLTNVDLEILWVESTGYNDKINLFIASNELKDITLIQDTKASTFVNASLNGVFWELTPQISKFNNLKAIDQVTYNNVKIEGKLYGLPRPRFPSRSGIQIRKDWLDSVGMKEPKNTNDLYNVMKAFTLNDPDKNGKNDTFGTAFIENSLSHFAGYGHPMGLLSTLFTGLNYWGEKDGKLYPVWTTEEYIDLLNFVKKLYTEKLINQDFAITKAAAQAAMREDGKVGLNIGDGNGVMGAAFFKKNPDAEVIYINNLEGVKGAKIPHFGGSFGSFVINKKGVDEKKMLRCLDYLDKSCNTDMIDVALYGLEGKYYTRNSDGSASKTAEQSALWSSNGTNLNNTIQATLGSGEFAGYKLIAPEPVKGTDTYKAQYLTKYIMRPSFETASKYTVTDPTFPFISGTQSEKGATLNKLVDDAAIKYILGTIDLAGFKKDMERWKNEGGNKIMEEYTAAYQKAKTK